MVRAKEVLQRLVGTENSNRQNPSVNILRESEWEEDLQKM